MNAPPPPAPDPDELASALVDGLLSPEEAARARQDPAVSRRVEEIMRVRSMLQTTPPPAPGAADRAVAAAMAAFDRPAHHLRAVDALPGRPAAARPSVRVRAARNAGWLAAAAAVVVVLLAAIGLLGTLGDQAGDDSAASSGGDAKVSDEAPAAPQQHGDDDSGNERNTEAEAGSGSAAAPLSINDLGSVNTEDELRRRVADSSSVAERSGAAPTAPAAGDEVLDSAGEACPGLTDGGDPARGTAIFVGRAIYKDQPVVVHVYDRNGQQRLVATTQACSNLVDVPYPG